MACPSTTMQSVSIRTGVSGSRFVLPFNPTRPARINSAACEREQYPSFDIARAKPIVRIARFDGTAFMLLEASSVLHAQSNHAWYYDYGHQIGRASCRE